MNLDTEILIDAPATTVWDVFSTVEEWPTWTESVTSLEALDSPELAIGRRYEIVQPKFPKLLWVVESIEPGTSWMWSQKSVGMASKAFHWVEPISESQCRARMRIEQTGPVAAIVGRITRKRSLRYMAMEGEGLKRVSEQRVRDGATT
jgi:Polyketide cyclase / dehydrase and lipid transport